MDSLRDRVAVSADGNTLYVHNFMDRSVDVFDVSEVVHTGNLNVTPIATVATVGSESLSANILLGKQLFYDARDPRLSLDSYMSCASCHSDGGQDGRIWDFTGVGEGLRNTVSLQGRGGIAHGFLHWSANFDEVQDFEGQIRNFAGGTGLMNDVEFFQGTRDEPLGDPKSGISPDLDALAAYVSSLTAFPDSPHRNADGSLTPDGQAGLLLFEQHDCVSCHTRPRFTDSANAVLHDVGTMTAASGSRLGGPLDGIDTPTLISVWGTGPYLHDGSAFDVTEAVQAHSGISLTTQELAQLGAYLDQLDGVTASISSGGQCGGLVQEAEAATLAGNFVVGSDPNASGGQYIEVPNGFGANFDNNTSVPDKAEYCFTVPVDGVYQLKGRVLATNGSDNSFWVTVDGQPTTGYLWDTSVNASYVEDYVNDRNGADPVLLNLTAGEHTVSVYWREDATRLDTLELELKPTPACGPMTQEAEAGMLSGAFFVGTDSNASGGQYIDVLPGTGNNYNGNTSVPHKAEYCFNVPSAGLYSLKGWVYAPNGNSDSFWVTIDGQPATGYLWDTLRNTSYAEDFMNDRNGADPVQVNLGAGQHTVTIYWREDGTRLDKLSLE